MWPRKLLDISCTDLAFGGLHCLFAREEHKTMREFEEMCGGRDHSMVCLSVRTGFDLLLQALRLPAGSEVIMTAITIPDMIEIVRRHGLVPVPLDLEFHTLAPASEALQKATTPLTRLIVVAHLFGIRVPMAPIMETAKKLGLMVVEDCAQAFEGWETIGCSGLSSETADASLYSFGPIKTATSLGGAVVRIRNVHVLTKMRAIHDRYPDQQQRIFALRILKYATMKLASNRFFYGWMMRACSCIRKEPDKLINSLARNFGKQDLLDNIRRRPCKSLVAMLARSCRRYPRARIDLRTALGHEFKRLLAHRVAIPGSQAKRHSYWVFPVAIEDSAETIQLLRQSGFDATQSHNLALLVSDSDGLSLEAPVMGQLLRNIVFLPIYPEMSHVAIKRMAYVLTQQTERKVGLTHGRKRVR